MSSSLESFRSIAEALEICKIEKYDHRFGFGGYMLHFCKDVLVSCTVAGPQVDAFWWHMISDARSVNQGQHSGTTGEDKRTVSGWLHP